MAYTDSFREESLDSLAGDAIWLGYFVLEDPLRADVPAAIEDCMKAGVQVKMITGDISATAQEIDRQLGLWTGDEPEGAHMTGAQFAALDDETALQKCLDLKIMSRARPLDKLRLVTLLQKRNQVVAVTGDGINDAAALNRAHVGLSMGSGKDVAKEASDIVLLDDSFKSIVNAIEWGRSLYENIQCFVLFQLTINVAALGVAMLGPFIGVQIPLTVTQMLWVNLIIDTMAALALATEPPKKEVLTRPPRNPQDFIVTPTMARQIFGMGGFFLVALLALLIFLQQDGITPKELTIFFSIFVMLQFWNLFNARCLGLTQSALRGLTENKGFMAIAASIFIGQVVIVQIGGQFFRTVPLSWQEWFFILIITTPVLVIGELLRMRARMMQRAH